MKIMTKIFVSLIFLTQFAFANNPTPAAEEEKTYTAVFFVQIADDVVMEMERIELDATFLKDRETAEMKMANGEIEALFNVAEISKEQNLKGKKAIFYLWENNANGCNTQGLYEYCNGTSGQYSGEGQCLGNNVLIHGWCIITDVIHPCMGYALACNSSVIK